MKKKIIQNNQHSIKEQQQSWKTDATLFQDLL